MRRPRILAALSLLCLVGVLATFVLVLAEEPTRERADELFEAKNYKEASDVYTALLDAGAEGEAMHHAARRVVLCRLRLKLFDEAQDAADRYVTLCRGTPYEARAERLVGNLWMTLPHWGTRTGGKFHRGQWLQGIQIRSNRHDKRKAIEHLSRARDLYAELDRPERAEDLATLPEEERGRWHEERLECLFDLAGVHSRFGIYENYFTFWYSFWGERDDRAAETAGEEDFEEYHSNWELQRKRPIGLRIGGDGEPVFPSAAKSYDPERGDDGNLLFLLDEIRSLDTSEKRVFTALSYYRQAMLARTRFGAERVGQYAGYYWYENTHPLQEELEAFKPWELEDGESLVLAGGKIRRVELPARWNPMALLRTVAGDYADAGLVPEASYAIALIHQTRQQYVTALGEYEALRKAHPKSKWAENAKTQIEKIRAPQVQLSDTGVQLPGEPARLQLSYRNLTKVWFTARRIDHEAFMREIRDQEIDPDKGLPHLWNLGQWSRHFVQGYQKGNQIQRIAAKHLGAEVARWSDEVPDDGTHRYARKELPAPLVEPGAYLVQAYFEEPPAEDAQKSGRDALGLGSSRAAVVLTDLAFVEKKSKDGNLYYVCDARTGAPVPGADLEVLEVWSTWDQKLKKSDYHKAMHLAVTDEDGLAKIIRSEHGGQLHVFLGVGAGAERRIAWSGMTYWGYYSPSARTSGRFAYVITDRPVYRPGHKVRIKVWLRKIKNGVYEEKLPRQTGVTVYDPRGNKVFEDSGRTDEFGGFDCEFTLGEEPRLGLYGINVGGANYAGGASFRVEEYKKPEFEVTVTPSETHTKLGQTVKAVIRADYYFGAPVTDATVSYKVFREEYRHTFYPPGEWDWLYGPGYGFSWYDYAWYPWWNWVRCCRVAPYWWYGWYGTPWRKPVRELVMQGETAIGADGTVEVEIDTSPALRDHGDRDHRYVVAAEVRDASRRVISGEGAVKVTRQAYYAMVQPHRGYHRPGEEMPVTIRCLTPENEPVQASGVVTVTEIVYGGPDNAEMKETELDRFPAETDDRGRIELNFRHEKSGLLRVGFEAPDSWGGVVKGYALVWVVGRDFDGRFHRFNDLELVTDKRTYRPGEVAHVMVNTRRAGSYVLFADEVDNGHLLSYRLLHLASRSTIVDVPVKEGAGPAFFLEAFTVSDTRVHSQIQRICVPPEESVLSVTVKTDKPEYEPGEEAEVEVTTLGPDGEPVKAQITLSAFDRSVLYIQGEFTPAIAKFFYGHVRQHSLQSRTNLTERFAQSGWVVRPYQAIHPAPPSWWGVWGPIEQNWPAASEDSLKDMLGETRTASLRRDFESLGGVAGDRSEAAAEAGSGSAPAAPASSPAGPGGGLGGGGAGGKFRRGEAEGKPAGPGEPALVEAEVRKKFADTAAWETSLVTGDDGKARTTFEMPENLTTWKVNAWAMTKTTQVGQADTSAVTTKDLIVRLQAPRFFMETDEVVLSANVHNYLETAKTARVSLEVPKELLALIGETAGTVDVEVPADGETRVDWRVKVLKEGVAKVLVKALTDEESDAMEVAFPVLVHGMTKQVATTGSMRPEDDGRTITVELTVPEKRRPELTRFEIKYTPTLAGAMLDALPYCLNYPYGCTEQTVSRFLPAVLTLRTLQNFGIKLEDVREIRRGRMEEIRRIEKGEKVLLWSYYADSAIFDEEGLARVISQSLQRIESMQNGDGGWGWWSRDDSSPYLTSYVLFALMSAREADVKVDQNMIGRGMGFLKGWEEGRLRSESWGPSPTHAFCAWVLSLQKLRAAIEPEKDDERPGDLIERLWLGRDQLNLYGKSLLALALANLGDERAETVLRNILQYVEVNEETQSAHFRTPDAGWWYWWNNDVETNAWILRALAKIDPKNDVSPKLVKWLLNNRRGGYYWTSTRDTTLCVAAMSDFVAATGEGSPDYTLRIDLDDGAVVKEVKINAENFFTFDNRFLVEGVALSGGKHTVKLTKTGKGALYFNTYLSYFTKEDHIGPAGHELKVERSYFRLEQVPYEVEVDGAEGQLVKEKRLRYERIPVKDGDEVRSGDLIQVELRVKADNSYTFLAFEDMKPAGCEPVDLRSGGKGQEGFLTYMELRDEKVVFFMSAIDQGEHLLRYRLRAEIPGRFHALPANLYAMYAPKLKANSEECMIQILD